MQQKHPKYNTEKQKRKSRSKVKRYRGKRRSSYLEVQREMKETRVRAIFEEIRAERELLRDTMHFK